MIQWTEQRIASDGQVTEQVHTYTELATGLHYWDEATGRWEAAVEAFELLPQGYAVARRGQHKVLLAGNINQGGSVDLELPDGSRMLSNPMGLSYREVSSGRNVLLAEVKDCVGEWVTPNTIIFFDAFDTLKASLRYTYTLGGFEQDVIIRELPPPPEAFGLNPDDVTLECYTEFFESPDPVVRSAEELAGTATDSPVGQEEGVETGESEGQVEAAVDRALDFGSMRMERGRAYILGADLEGIEVAKAWERLDGRLFLIESVSYRDVAPLLESLAASPQAESATLARRTVQGRAGLAGLLMPRGPGRALAGIQRTGRPVGSGLVLDYSTLNSSQTNYTFRGDSTYYITALVNLYQTTQVEAGAVLKYANSGSPEVRFNGPVNWQASPYRPVICTAKDDNSVGASIVSGNPSGIYAYRALNFYSGTGAMLVEHLRVRHAAIGVAFYQGVTHDLRHAQFSGCSNSVYSSSSPLRLRNVLIENCSARGLDLSSASVVGEHLTFSRVSQVVYPANSLTLTNSLLVSVTNWSYAFAGAHNATNASTNVFQWAGAGAHYLAAASPYRNAGSTNIHAGLLSELRQRTTYPPVTLTSPISTATALGPVVQRDSDLPDLGFHYTPLDYLASNVVVQAALTLTNGVAIGGYGTRWFELASGSSVIGEGSPLQPVRLVHLQNVQEQVRAWGGGSQFYHTSATHAPRLRLRFSEHAGVPGLVGTLYSTGGDYPLEELSFQHCTLRAGSLGLYPVSAAAVTVGLTNTLVERCTLVVGKAYNAINTPLSVDLYNNLFQGGELTLHYYDGTQDPVWAVKDNLFVGASQNFYKDSRGETQVQRSNNAFTTNTATTFGGTGSLTNLVADFQTGPLGRFYYPATGGSSSLTNLVNRGSRYATNAGLYHFTTTTNQVKEATSQVDIGFHYVAVDAATGLPLDFDGDGIPDVLEDRNGDGSPTGDPTSWQSYDSANGLTGNPGLLVFTPLQ